jgi:SAM-dependent methyltransferase
VIIDKKDIYTRFAKYTVAEMNCPICKSDSGRLFCTCLKRETVYQPEVPELMTRYVKCKTCGIVYAKNAVIGYSLYVTPPEVDRRIEGLGGLMPEDPERISFNLEMIQKAYGKRGGFSLLDVGCSGGEFLELALQSHVKAEGVETNTKFADEARKRTNTIIYEGDICEVSIPSKYDVINGTEIIEHIIEPDKFLNAIHKVLNPGGMIYITTMPNASSLRVRLSRCETPMIRDTFSHHVLYNSRSMRCLLQKHGFVDIRFHHYRRDGWSIKNLFMRFINKFGYFDNQVIATAWK